MSVAVLNRFRIKRHFDLLADRPAEDADWPLGLPAGLTRLGELTEDDHLVVSITSKTLLADLSGLRCKVSAILFHGQEPKAALGELMGRDAKAEVG